MKESRKGVYFKGAFWPLYGGGGYCSISNNPSFLRGGLPDVSRAIKAEMHDAAVCVEYETEERRDV